MSAILPTVYLIRHGETEWSRDGRHTGTTDLPLTCAGEAMAHALEPWFADLSFALVLTSPVRRARDTCKSAGLSAQATVSADLSEWDYGDYEGRSSRDIGVQSPGWNVFRDGCPGGETPVQVSRRADRVIAGLLEIEGNVALFSHGQFGCALAVRWIGLAVAQGVHFTLDAGSVSMMGPKPGHPHVPALLQWNGGPSAHRPQSRPQQS